LTTVGTAAVALSVSLAGCTTVTSGAAVLGDRGPCTHVDTQMLDVPSTRSTEPRMRIPQPAGWEPSTEFEEADPSLVLASSNTGDELPQGRVAVFVEPVSDAEVPTLFDDFTAGLEQVLAEEGLPSELTRTAGTHCGLRSETVAVAGPDPASTLLVVAESGGDTYLIAVAQTTNPDSPSHRRNAETILTGFEVLPQDSAAAA
jgi:hypothetical protein